MKALFRSLLVCLAVAAVLGSIPGPGGAWAAEDKPASKAPAALDKPAPTSVEELKAIEARISSTNEQKVEAENARFKGLVTTYENMKPKDAAKVFDRLEMPVLIEIAQQIAPRKMSDIMGQMQPEAAERLTVELAHRASGDKSTASAELPKIEGKMLPQKPK